MIYYLTADASTKIQLLILWTKQTLRTALAIENKKYWKIEIFLQKLQYEKILCTNQPLKLANK